MRKYFIGDISSYYQGEGGKGYKQPHQSEGMTKNLQRGGECDYFIEEKVKGQEWNTKTGSPEMKKEVSAGIVSFLQMAS